MGTQNFFFVPRSWQDEKDLNSLSNRLVADLYWQYGAVDRMWYNCSRIPPVHADTKPRVVTSKDKPFTAPLVSESAVIRFRGLEREIQDNIGERGIAKLHNADELLRAALVLSRSSSVGIHFGFPCNTNNEFPDETDDTLGAIALGKDLKTLGKEVTFIASYYYVKLVQVLVETFLGNMACVVEFTP